MGGTRTSLLLLLLLNLLHLHQADVDQNLLSQTPHLQTEASSSDSAPELNVTTKDDTNDTDAGANGTFCDCLIDTELGLIAIGSAGGLIFCLLVSTIVLACQVYHIQHRVYVPRTSRSNVDLVSGTCYWEANQPEAQGLVGPCDASVMLEEVREENQEDPREERREEAGTGQEEQTNYNSGEKMGHLSTSRSRESCLEVLKDLEDMPLVV